MRKKIFLLILFCFLFQAGLVYPAGNISLSVITQEGSTNTLDFGRLKAVAEDGQPTGDSCLRTVRISVTNTSGRRYQITQRLSGAILNENGDALPAEAVTFLCFGSSTSGQLYMLSPTPLNSSGAEQLLFLSDAAGKDDSFQIQYTLQPGDKTGAGRYNANIIYNVVTIQ
jgi:hypothetical protein